MNEFGEQQRKRKEELYLKGETLINLNRYEEAIKYFDKSLKLDRTCVSALNAKGNALMHLNRFDDAIKCFEEVISLNLEDSNALNDSWIGKEDSLIKLEIYEYALSCCDKIIELREPGYVRILRKFVKLFIDAKRYSETKKWLYKVVSENTNEKSLFSLKKDALSRIQKEEEQEKFKLLLGRIHYLKNQKRHEELHKCLREALDFEKEVYYILYLDGDALMHLNRYEEAVECWDELLELDRTCVSALNAKGDALMHLNRYEEAVECFEEVISLNPEDNKALNDSWSGEVVIYIQMKRYEEAFSCCDKIIELREPGYVRILRKFVKLFIDAKRYSETKKWLYKVVSENTNEKSLFSLKKDALSRIQKEEETQEKVKRLLTRMNDLSNQGRYKDALECLYKTLSNDYELSKNYEKSIKYFEKAIKLDYTDAILLNDFAEAYLNMAKNYSNNDELYIISLHKAFEYSDKARLIDSDNFDIWFTAAKIQNKLKNYGEAIKYASKAKKLNPKDSNTLKFIDKVKMLSDKAKESKEKDRLNRIRGSIIR